ncbi:MAG: DMT family transporter [Acidiferrobacteraceae bacterium]
MSHSARSGIASALGAAVLFGASTPLAKILLGPVSPILLAGLLYLGSGVGLILWWLLRRWCIRTSAPEAALSRRDLPWLGGAIMSGGVIAPVLLMLALTHLAAADASLLLNLEGVFTALLAWFVFHENFNTRLVLGIVLIVTAGVVLSWPTRQGMVISYWALAIVGACLAWAIDNNLTRKISAGDPVQIASIKGLIAGCTNTGIALGLGHTFPAAAIMVVAGMVGLIGYGLSLVLFVLALRHLGGARTAAYFSTAPFVGVAISVLLLRETPSLLFWVMSGFMATGVWLHVTERHEHEHMHESLVHSHDHVHDSHHRHKHNFPWDGREPHTHTHQHEPLTHTHPHHPDIHHRHRH